jgi:hypothetical protein
MRRWRQYHQRRRRRRRYRVLKNIMGLWLLQRVLRENYRPAGADRRLRRCRLPFLIHPE